VRATLSTLLVTLAVSGAVAYAFRLPPATGMNGWLAFASTYAALALAALWSLRRRGVLADLMRFRPGDPSIGIGLGVLLLVSSWVLSGWLLPADSVERAWLLRVLVLLGGTSTPAVTACLMAVAACEELVWRGWVQGELGLALGARQGWVIGALLYGVAHAATLWTLRDAAAGYNPLIVLGAVGCGICWAFLRERTGRLMPGIFAHVAFTYLATQYLWRFV
jgi:membrane protease YdiL (CAAX protease family)